MNKAMDKVIKKHVKLAMLTVIAVVLAVLGTSYAIFVSQNRNTTDQTINIGTFDVSLTDQSGQVLITDIYPSTEAEVGDNNKYTFTVTNKGTYNVTYETDLVDGTSTFLADATNKATYASYTPLTTDDYQYIYIKMSSDSDAGTATKLNTIYDSATKNMKLKTETLAPGASKTYTLQFWEDENSPNTMIGRILELNLNLTATAIKE